MLAGINRILAEARTHGSFFDNRQRRRQCARAQQNGEIVGGLNCEIAGNLPGAAQDRLADDGRRDNLVVEYDGEGLAHIGLCHLGEFARTGRIETEINDRLVGTLIEAGLRIDEIGARNQHALLDQILLARRFARQNLGIGRVRLLRLLGCHRLIDHPEVELCRLAQDFLQPRGILQTRHLDEYAIGAFALDRRLDEAEFVDATLDDLDRLIDRLAHPLSDGGIGGA